jgi:sugar phosphate isomerase/epimerase
MAKTYSAGGKFMHPGHGNHIHRRRFLQKGAATVGLAALAGSLRADQSKDSFGPFTFGAQSYCFRQFNTEQALQRTQALGLHFIEFYQKHAPLGSTPTQIKALLNLCKENDIKPIAYGVQAFGKDHDANKRTFDFGKALGIRVFSADPDPGSFDSLDKLVEEYAIAVAIHPHGPTGRGKLHRWYSAEVIMAAVKDHHPKIGSCLDTGHLIRAAQLGKKLDPVEEIRVMGARNFAIHLKDHDNAKHTDVIYGQGVLDVPGVLRALREVKFAGHISIEYEAHPEDPSADMKACLAVVQDAVRHLG